MKMGSTFAALTVATATMMWAAAGARAGTIGLFTGTDPGAVPGGTRTNSDAAAASFDAAAAKVGTLAAPITFEDQAVGANTGLTVAPGVGLTFTSASTTKYGVETAASSPIGFNNILGFNTTAGGAKAYQIYQGNSTTTFTFATPVDAFGTYVSGLGNNNNLFTVNFSDGTAQSLPVTGNSFTGGLQFFGFTDTGASISSIALSSVNTGDIFALDDVQYAAVGSAVVTAATPLPTSATAGTACLGLLAVGTGLRRRRAATA